MDHICPILQNCPNCGVKGTTIANTGFSSVGPYSEWCRTIGCDLCSVQWFVCLECFGLRSHMRDRKAVQAHHIRAHHVQDKKTSNKRKRDTRKKKKHPPPACLPDNGQILAPWLVHENNKEQGEQGDEQGSCQELEREPIETEERETMERKTEEPQEASNCQIDSDVEGNDDSAQPSHQHNDSLVSDNLIAFTNQDIRDPDPVAQNLNTISQISQEAQEFDNEFTSRYYQSIYANGTMGSGGKQLVSDTFYKGETKPDNIDDDDVDICLQMSVLAHSLSTRQTKLLGSFMDLLFKKIDLIQQRNLQKNVSDLANIQCPNCHCNKCQNRQGCEEAKAEAEETLAIPSLPPVPRNFKQIRKTIMSGARAFFPRLPRPLVHMSG